MGGSNGEVNSPLKCFNAQKNWVLGWYKDKQLEINSGSSWVGKLVSFVDYDQASPSRNEYVLLKTGNLYIQYNRKEGFNSQTREHWNKVTVVYVENTNKQLIQSEMLAGLDSGLTATVFGVRITVCYRSAGPPDYAFVSIRPEGQPSNCPRRPLMLFVRKPRNLSTKTNSVPEHPRAVSAKVDVLGTRSVALGWFV